MAAKPAPGAGAIVFGIAGSVWLARAKKEQLLSPDSLLQIKMSCHVMSRYAMPSLLSHETRERGLGWCAALTACRDGIDGHDDTLCWKSARDR